MKKIITGIFLLMLSTAIFAKQNMKSDEYYMKIAIALAKHNPKEPFGALIVDNKTGKILAQGLNAVQLDPTYHGEMMVIHNYAKKYPHPNWSGVTLYTTAEPCSMCQSAIIWAGISRVVYSTSNVYLGEHSKQNINLRAAEVISRAPFYKGTLTGDVLARESEPMFHWG